MAAWDLWSSVYFVSDWQYPSQFVVWIVFLQIKYFSFHSSKCCSRSRDYPKNVLDALEITAPGKEPLIEQIFSLPVKFPTLPSQALLARAQSLTLAVKVREAVSSLQLTDPGCPSCKGCIGNQKTEPGSEQPSLTGTVRSPISWHCGHLTTCNTSLCRERRSLTVQVGNEHKAPVE